MVYKSVIYLHAHKKFQILPYLVMTFILTASSDAAYVIYISVLLFLSKLSRCISLDYPVRELPTHCQVTDSVAWGCTVASVSPIVLSTVMQVFGTF